MRALAEQHVEEGYEVGRLKEAMLHHDMSLEEELRMFQEHTARSVLSGGSQGVIDVFRREMDLRSTGVSMSDAHACGTGYSTRLIVLSHQQWYSGLCILHSYLRLHLRIDLL